MVSCIRMYALIRPSILLQLIRVDKANVHLMDSADSAIQLQVEKHYHNARKLPSALMHICCTIGYTGR
jgi:hypothetical protein